MPRRKKTELPSNGAEVSPGGSDRYFVVLTFHNITSSGATPGRALVGVKTITPGKGGDHQIGNRLVWSTQGRSCDERDLFHEKNDRLCEALYP